VLLDVAAEEPRGERDREYCREDELRPAPRQISDAREHGLTLPRKVS
jgi:hypothetical protein